ncbi:SRPBCC family protein [Flavihumibacter solisilvae]|jgi:hypothetical protein|uniref:Polyketide cyclase n=1 Tax=Flavihumibacter solisilvae TaxID=1349421 RepID=A0A0C1L6P5_9BACT|nr:SRPBCC family protein [Flavihumibacter solisilvae]KIC95817.1 polyketide cyclase [Flavihumibacter solisilvae]
MRTLKITGIVLGSIIALLLVIALFVKKDYSVTREVTINKPKGEVFNYVKFVKNQDNFSKWNQMDPAMKKSYKGTDGSVGFIYGWDSQDKNVGMGSQEIKNIIEGERVDLDIHFIKPFEGDASADFITEAVSENQTKVKWEFNSRMPYPMNLMRLFMDMEGMIGDDLQTGLNNLKSVLEKS